MAQLPKITRVRNKRQSQVGADAVGKRPDVTSLEPGEIAINTVDGKLFLKRQRVNQPEDIVEVGANPYPTEANSNTVACDTGITTAGKFLQTDGSAIHWATPSSVAASTVDVTQQSHGFAAGTIVYYDGTEYARAKADNLATADVVGIVTIPSTDSFTLLLSGMVDFQYAYPDPMPGPWLPSKTYYLSATASGVLTDIEPSDAGQISKPLLVAITSKRGLFNNWRGIVNDIPATDIDSLLPVQNTNTIGKVLTSGADGNCYWDIGGGSGAASAIDVTQAAHGLSKGQLVRFDGASNRYLLAQADNGTNADVIGIVSSVMDSNSFVLTTQGIIQGLNGLVNGASYFLSADVPGSFTITEPTRAGEISKPVLIAISSTEALFVNWRGIGVSILAQTPEVAAQPGNAGKYLTTNGTSTNWVLPVTSFNARTGDINLVSTDVVNALGFVPYNGATNANGYITATQAVSSFNARVGSITLTLSDVVSAGGAPSVSPLLTGIPRCPTPPLADNSNRIATTEFVLSNAQAIVQTNINAYAPINSPVLTGNPQAPTAAPTDNDTTIATTAFVQNVVAAATATAGGLFAVGSGISVVGDGTVATSSTYTFQIPDDGHTYILQANNYSTSAYNGNPTATGLVSQIYVDSNSVAEDDSTYTAATAEIFRATSTVMRVLPAGTRTVAFRAVTQGTTMTSNISLLCDYFIFKF